MGVQINKEALGLNRRITASSHVKSLRSYKSLRPLLLHVLGGVMVSICRFQDFFGKLVPVRPGFNSRPGNILNARHFFCFGVRSPDLGAV